MAGSHVASLEEEKRKRKIRDVRWNIAGSSALGVSLFGAAAALIFGGVMMCMAAGPVGLISLALIGFIFLIAIPAALCIWQGVDAFMSADHLRKNELRELQGRDLTPSSCPTSSLKNVQGVMAAAVNSAPKPLISPEASASPAPPASPVKGDQSGDNVMRVAIGDNNLSVTYVP